MDVHITTRHTKLSDEEHQAAVSAAEHLERFHNQIMRLDIITSEEGDHKIAEFTARVQGQTIVAKEKASDHAKAIHDARDKIERQLKRLNDRQHDVRATLA